MLYGIHKACGVRDEIVYINTLGDFATRKEYVPELKSYLEHHRDELDPDSVSRLETNPLRVLDSKDKSTQAVLERGAFYRRLPERRGPERSLLRWFRQGTGISGGAVRGG